MTLQELFNKLNDAPDFLATYGALEVTIEGKAFDSINYEIVPDLVNPFPHQHMNINLTAVPTEVWGCSNPRVNDGTLLCDGNCSVCGYKTTSAR